jgi:dihydrofolate reductase
MAKLIYAAFTSFDGYVADETGNFDWAELDEEVHAFINSRERQIGTYLFGCKMYETMAVWETPDVFPHRTAAVLEFAPIWQAAEKIVYSTTLQTSLRPRRGSSGNSTRTLYGNSKAGATREVAVGGLALAAHAIRAGLVDEYHLLIAPIIAGSGNPYLPGKVAVKLELLDERRFDNGMVHVRYRAKS